MLPHDVGVPYIEHTGAVTIKTLVKKNSYLGPFHIFTFWLVIALPFREKGDATCHNKKNVNPRIGHNVIFTFLVFHHD